jgi:hypothetical protein
MIEDMTIRNLSPATQRSYISAVSKLSRHFGRSPDRTVNGLWAAIGRIIDLFPPAECANYFSAAGYDAT